MPRSTMMGFMPASTSSSAAKSPAGPAPTITTDAPPPLPPEDSCPPPGAAPSLSAPPTALPAAPASAASAAALLPAAAATAAASAAAASAARAADVASEREAILATAAEAMSGEMSGTTDPAVDGAAGKSGPPDGDGSSLPWFRFGKARDQRYVSRGKSGIGDPSYGSRYASYFEGWPVEQADRGQLDKNGKNSGKLKKTVTCTDA